MSTTLITGCLCFSVYFEVASESWPGAVLIWATCGLLQKTSNHRGNATTIGQFAARRQVCFRDLDLNGEEETPKFREKREYDNIMHSASIHLGISDSIENTNNQP